MHDLPVGTTARAARKVLAVQRRFLCDGTKDERLRNKEDDWAARKAEALRMVDEGKLGEAASIFTAIEQEKETIASSCDEIPKVLPLSQREVADIHREILEVQAFEEAAQDKYLRLKQEAKEAREAYEYVTWIRFQLQERLEDDAKLKTELQEAEQS
eukprot:9546321-Karenia_brevis.AAC.1